MKYTKAAGVEPPDNSFKHSSIKNLILIPVLIKLAIMPLRLVVS